MNVVTEFAPGVGTALACHALGVSRAAYYRRQQPLTPVLPKDHNPSPRALSPTERRDVLEVLNSPRFMDQAPPQIHATLLDEGVYHLFHANHVSHSPRPAGSPGTTRSVAASAVPPARTDRHGTLPSLVLGYHLVAGTGQGIPLSPVRDSGHLQPVLRGLAARPTRMLGTGRQADPGNLCQTACAT
ncbi:MAG: Integrase, catalytic region [Schlesneria sp.]|nr:Integrase, catalytic region [Schlesneria sp.]